MTLIAAAGLTAFVLCLIITPLVRNISSWAKLLDHPDKERKLHRRAMPRLGGIAIAISYVGAIGLILITAPHHITSALLHSSLVQSLLPATGLIFLTGLIDDLITLKPWQKLLGQTVASALAVFLGAHLSLPYGPSWIGLVLSFLWLLACTNAFNLIDGIDGLATGVALITALATFVPAIMDKSFALSILSISLIGCLLAFLRYNFQPASIFLGDCGSLSIGFMLGCFGLSWSRHSDTSLGRVAPLIALSLPLLDVALAIARRFVRNTPLFQGDRSHIHHKVLSRSMTTWKAVLILYGVCCCTSIFAILLSYSPPHLQWIILFIFCVLAWAGIRSLRYIELIAVIRSFSRRSMLRVMKQEIYLLELEHALAKAETVEAMWDITCIACEDLRLTSARMQLYEHSFAITLREGEEDMAWEMTISLGAKGYLALTRERNLDNSRLMFSVLDCLQNSILHKDLMSEAHQVALSPFSYQGAA